MSQPSESKHTTALNDSSLLRAPSNEPDRTIAFFWMFVVVHVLVWMAICLLTQPNMPLDMVEMLYWGQQWQLGYHKHPPLPAWTAATMWEVGQHHPWAMYLTSQLTIVITYWAVWQLARNVLSPKLALCSVLVMEGCYYGTYMINDINNTIMTRPFWALAILFMYRALASPTSRSRLMYWCLTGTAIGLGMLCKYYMGVLVLSLLMIPVLMPSTRVALRSPGPWLMASIACLIFLPHFIWMVENDFITIRYIFNRSGDAAASSAVSGMAAWMKHITSPVSFVVSQLAAVIPVVVLLLPLLLRSRKSAEIRTEKVSNAPDHSGNFESTAFFRKYLAIAVGGPVAIYLVLALVSGAAIRSMWGGPLFSFLGLLLIVLFKVEYESAACRKVIRDSLIVGCLMALGLFVRNGFGPAVRGELSKVHFPGAQVAQMINQRWSDHYQDPLQIVGGEMFVSGCVGVYSDQPVDVFGDLIPEANPWVSDERLQKHGGMIVWDIDEQGAAAPVNWLSRFPNAEVLEPFACKTRALTGDVSAHVGVLLVHPQKSSLAKRTGPDSLR